MHTLIWKGKQCTAHQEALTLLAALPIWSHCPEPVSAPEVQVSTIAPPCLYHHSLESSYFESVWLAQGLLCLPLGGHRKFSDLFPPCQDA